VLIKVGLLEQQARHIARRFPTQVVVAVVVVVMVLVVVRIARSVSVI